MLIQEHHAHKRLTHIIRYICLCTFVCCDECVSVHLKLCPPVGAASHAGSDRPLASGSVEPAAVLAVLHFELGELPLAALNHPEQQYNLVSHCKASC